jgi:hypothetical protein
MQSDQPIVYASRALTKTEQNYAQVEKELRAVVFGMEKIPPIHIRKENLRA